MGCGGSKNKNKNRKNTNSNIDRKNTRGTRTPRVLNDWGNIEPLAAPYPQGTKDLTKVMKSDSMQAGTIYDPNPELVMYEIQGEYVPIKEFYSITPVQPIKGLDEDKQDKNFIDDNRQTDRNTNRRQDRQVQYA